MSALKTDAWPHCYFYNVGERRAICVNALRDAEIRFRVGSTKGRGPGRFYQMIAMMHDGRRFHKFLSEAMYLKLKAASTRRQSRRPARSGKRSRSSCNAKKR